MLMLMSRLFGLFALKSKKSLFLVGGIVLAAIIAQPILISPVVRILSINSNIRLISKINSIERTKLKEAVLKKGYDRLLSDYMKPEAKVSLAPPGKPAKLRDYWDKSNLGKILAGAVLWIVLGIIGLFARDFKIGPRILTLFVFCLIGLGCGLALVKTPAVSPFPVYAALVAIAEIALASTIGTLIRELNNRQRLSFSQPAYRRGKGSSKLKLRKKT